MTTLLKIADFIFAMAVTYVVLYSRLIDHPGTNFWVDLLWGALISACLADVFIKEARYNKLIEEK